MHAPTLARAGGLLPQRRFIRTIKPSAKNENNLPGNRLMRSIIISTESKNTARQDRQHSTVAFDRSVSQYSSLEAQSVFVSLFYFMHFEWNLPELRLSLVAAFFSPDSTKAGSLPLR